MWKEEHVASLGEPSVVCAQKFGLCSAEKGGSWFQRFLSRRVVESGLFWVRYGSVSGAADR